MPRTNRVTLTDRAVRAATVLPTRQSADVYDALVPGLVLRVTRSGRRSFFVIYKDATGKKKWIIVNDPALGSYLYPVLSLARARELAIELLREAGGGRDPIAARAAAATQQTEAHTRTLRALGDLYIERVAKQELKSWREYERIIRTRLTPLLDRPVTLITRHDVRAIIDAMRDRGKRTYANRILAVARLLLNYGVREDWLDANPIAGKITTTPEKDRDKVLTDAELRKVWAVLEAPPPDASASRVRLWPLLSAWCRLRIVTAQRGEEVINLQWAHLQDLDGRRPVWEIPDTKNGRPQIVPLSKMAVAMLTALRARSGDPVYVFAGIRSARDRHQVIPASVVAGLQLRDLRRTAATNLGKLGVKPFFISRVLNHTDGSVTAIYNKWDWEPEKRDALTKWATHLQGIVGPMRLVRKRGAA